MARIIAPPFSDLSEEDIQSLTVYGEARGEKFAGQFAVAFVLKNRHDLWKQNYHQICLAPNQFSCYLESNPNFLLLKFRAQQILDGNVNDESLRKCKLAVQGVQGAVCKDNTDMATFFRVIGTKNRWFDGAVEKGTLIKTVEVGHHEFFREAKYREA